MPLLYQLQFADYLVDQLWGDDSANSIKNSLRYFAERALGDPYANNNFCSFLTGNVTVNGEVKGGRQALNFFWNSGAADFYINPGSTSIEFGYYMGKAGSIVGLYTSAKCVTFTSPLSIILRTRVNAVDKLVTPTITFGALNEYQVYYTKVARGLYPFSAGNRVECFNDYISGTASASGFLIVDVHFDT